MRFVFSVNMEERVPGTGKVYFVSRMTSDYAEAHPFDLDGFIEDVFQKYQKIAADDPSLKAWAKTREELRQQWIKTISVTRPSGDSTIYPNCNGRQEPALMEVWHKAGDYWRRGFRYGDQLPALVPGCKITRLGNGEWIALFPKDLHLLTDEQPIADVQTEQQAPTPSVIEAEINQEAEPEVIQAVEPNVTEEAPIIDDEETIREQIRIERRMQRRLEREQREQQLRLWEEEQALMEEEQEDEERRQMRRKIMAGIGAAATTLLLIHFFGLIGPAIFGLIIGGVLRA